MTLSEVQNALERVGEVSFILPTGEKVPPHFHVTEVGSIKKHFIDCGGTLRHESVISFQLYTDVDYDHRLSTGKLNSILKLSAAKLGLDDDQIEVEYQGETIGKYGLSFDGSNFQLTTKQTDCLAKDGCGIPTAVPAGNMEKNASEAAACCGPNSTCC